MTWTYRQSTGELTHHGSHVATGYSGLGADKNQPSDEDQRGQGPIPCGLWRIGAAEDHPALGPLAMPLEHLQGDDFGRSGFFIHGDSVSHPGQASHGCIILDHATRETIAADADRLLSVVA